MHIEPNDLLLFAHVVDDGSFTKAALRLGLPKSTVSRRLATLENGELAKGGYQVAWDMSGTASGAYFVRLRAGNTTLTRMVLKAR